MRWSLAALTVAGLIGAGCSGADGDQNGAGGGLPATGEGYAVQFVSASTSPIAMSLDRAFSGTLDATLAHSLLERLDRADWATAEQAHVFAFERFPSGTAKAWESPATGQTGVIVPTSTRYDATGQPCRSFVSTADVDGRESRIESLVCRRAGGTWYAAAF